MLKNNLNKHLIILLFLLLLSQAISSQEINVANLFTFDLSNLGKYNESRNRIVHKDNKYYLTTGFSFSLKENIVKTNRKYDVSVYLKTKDNIALSELYDFIDIPAWISNTSYVKLSDKLKKDNDFDTYFTYIKNGNYYELKKGLNESQLLKLKLLLKEAGYQIKNNVNHFGQGDIYKFFKEPAKYGFKDQDLHIFFVNSTSVQRVISVWSSDIDHDIIAYNFMINNHPIFSECLITSLNLYPPIKDEDLVNSKVNQLLLEDSSQVEIYKIFDDLIKTIEFTYEPVFFTSPPPSTTCASGLPLL